MEFITRKEAAKYFRVHERTIERWVRSGILKGYKLGAGKNAILRISKSEIKKFLEKSKITTKK